MAEEPGLVDGYALYGDGSWIEPEDGRYEDISPTTEAAIATAPSASVAQVERAIAAVRRAFDRGPWHDAGPEERGKWLRQLGTALMQHAEAFFALSRDVEDAISIASGTDYGLSGAVWGRDVERAVAVARRIRTGQIAINGCGPGDAPFGGFKQSGLGREGGLTGLRQYMEPKAIGIPA